MANPGIYFSPAEAWAFVPFLGALAATGLVILAVLFWMAGRRRRLMAALVTLVALTLGSTSILGLLSAASSFEQRDRSALALYSVAVHDWAQAEYGIELVPDEVAELVQGRSVTVDLDDIPTEVRLRPQHSSTDVHLVGTDSLPVR